MTTYDLEILIRTKKTGDDPSPPPDSGFKWTELASKVSLAKQAFETVAAGAKIAYDNIKAGAELEAARGRFDNLTSTINTTGDALLGKLKAATKGMVSDAALIAGASDIISLGLAQNETDTVRLATAVSTLGLDMQQVILTFANNSKARLDSLGLSVEGVTQKAAELEAQGFKGDAFDEAVIIGLEEKMTLLGDASQTTAGQMQILESEWTNLVNMMKEGAAEIAGPVVSAIVGDIQAQKQLTAAYEAGIITWREWRDLSVQSRREGGLNAETNEAYADVLQRVEDRTVALTEHTRDLNAQYQEVEPRVTEAAAAFLAQDDTLRNVNRRILELGGNLGPTTQELEEMAYASGDLAAFEDKLFDSTQNVTTAQGRWNEALTNSNERLAESSRLNAEAAAQRAILAAQTGDIFTAISEADGALKFYNEDLASLEQQYATVGGRTAEQNEDLERLQSAYDKSARAVRDYEIGLKGANLTDEERAEKIADQQEEMARLQETMAPLLGISGELVSVNNQLSINQDAVNSAMISAADAAGADAAQLAILKVATGELTPVQAEAVIKSVALEQTLKNLGEQYAKGDLSLQGYMNAAQQAVTDINEMTVSFNEQTGAVSTTNAEAAALIDTLGRLPTHHDFVIKMTTEGQLPTLPTAPGSGQTAVAQATGGTFGSGRLYRVGEGNLPEIGMIQSSGKLFMIPGERGQTFSNSQAQGLLGGGFTDNSQISIVNNNLEAAATTNALVQERRRARLDSYMGVG
jgi:hypothetical protein